MLWCCHLSSCAADLFCSTHKSPLTSAPGMSGMRPVWVEATSCLLIGCCHLIKALIGQKRNNRLCYTHHISQHSKLLRFLWFTLHSYLLLKQWKGKGMRVSNHLNIKFDDVEISPILTWSGLSVIIPITGDNDDPWHSANTRSGFDLILFNRRIMVEFEAMRWDVLVVKVGLVFLKNT